MGVHELSLNHIKLTPVSLVLAAAHLVLDSATCFSILQSTATATVVAVGLSGQSAEPCDLEADGTPLGAGTWTSVPWASTLASSVRAVCK